MVKTGKDWSAWNYPDLAETLKTLKSGKSLICPVTKRTLIPTECLIFDAPLGRRHEQTGQYIDFLVWIDLPPDISLARWLLRDYRNKPDAKSADILEELEFYLAESRPLFVNNHEAIAEADLVVDGSLPTEALVQIIVDGFERSCR